MAPVPLGHKRITYREDQEFHIQPGAHALEIFRVESKLIVGVVGRIIDLSQTCKSGEDLKAILKN